MSSAVARKRRALAALLSASVAAAGPNGGCVPGAHWDSWGHYHCMLGCLLWAEASGDPTAAAVAAGVGAVVCAAFPTAQKLYAQVRKHTMRSDFSGPRFGRLSGKCQSFVGGSSIKLQMHRT